MNIEYYCFLGLIVLVVIGSGLNMLGIAIKLFVKKKNISFMKHALYLEVTVSIECLSVETKG